MKIFKKTFGHSGTQGILFGLFIRLITSYELQCLSHQQRDKVIHTANQNILIPLRKVLPIARY